MKLKTLLTLLSALAIACSANAQKKGDHEDTPLGKEMSAMNRSLRQLKRQVADPAKKADNLALLEKIKKNMDAAHNLEPAKTKDQPDKAAYTNKFKDQIVELGKALGELEAAIKVDKVDDARKALDRISDLKEKGHKDFEVD